MTADGSGCAPVVGTKKPGENGALTLLPGGERITREVTGGPSERPQAG